MNDSFGHVELSAFTEGAKFVGLTLFLCSKVCVKTPLCYIKRNL